MTFVFQHSRANTSAVWEADKVSGERAMRPACMQRW